MTALKPEQQQTINEHLWDMRSDILKVLRRLGETNDSAVIAEFVELMLIRLSAIAYENGKGDLPYSKTESQTKES